MLLRACAALGRTTGENEGSYDPPTIPIGRRWLVGPAHALEGPVRRGSHGLDHFAHILRRIVVAPHGHTTSPHIVQEFTEPGAIEDVLAQMHQAFVLIELDEPVLGLRVFTQNGFDCISHLPTLGLLLEVLLGGRERVQVVDGWDEAGVIMSPERPV